MSQPENGRTEGTAPRTSLLDVIKVVIRLGPKQINDEIQLAISQMKTKGVAAGIAVALMVVGVVFLAFLAVALIIAAVAGLSLVFEAWAAALIVAGVFLIIALIFALIGLFKLKKTMPLLPEDAIRGFRLDLGVAKEGTRFDPKTLDREDAERRREKEESKREAAEQAKKDSKVAGAGSPTPPTYSERLRRTAIRREHLASLQDQITSGSRQIAETVQEKTTRKKPRRVRPVRTTPAEPGVSENTAKPASSGSSSEDSSAHAAGEFVAARWKPLSVAAGSAAAGAVFLRELMKK